MKHIKVGRYQAFVSIGQLYVDRLPHHAPGSWRTVVARHPVWLPFSERIGARPGPNVRRIGPIDIAHYSAPEETR